MLYLANNSKAFPNLYTPSLSHNKLSALLNLTGHQYFITVMLVMYFALNQPQQKNYLISDYPS